MTKQDAQGRKGFSLLELLIILGIILVIGAVSVPRMNSVISRVRVRSHMTAMSGLIQNARSIAVQRNKTMTARVRATPHSLAYFIKSATDGNDLKISDPQIDLGAETTTHAAPSGPGAPPELTTDDLGFKGIAIDPAKNIYLSFNSRGLPCLYSGSTCANSGFVAYFNIRENDGGASWTAVAVSPAGRIKPWFWRGTSWSD